MVSIFFLHFFNCGWAGREGDIRKLNDNGKKDNKGNLFIIFSSGIKEFSLFYFLIFLK